MNLIKKIISKVYEDKNIKELTNNVSYTFLIKGVAMLITVLIVPAYVAYFNNDIVYGAWLTVGSVFTWIMMFDFGIGNGLRNYLVKSLEAKNEEASKKYISSAYISVGLISLIFAVVGALLIALLDWNALLKVPNYVVSLHTFRVYIGIVYLGVVIHFFFLLVSSICYAIQKPFIPNLFTLATQIILLIFLYIPNDASLETRIIELSLVHLLAYNLPILIATMVLFFGKLRSVRPSFKSFDRDATNKIISLGGLFFFIQIAQIALYSSNEIYINAFFESGDVVQYQYYYKLFYIIPMFSILITQPLWSAITKAYYEKRYVWIKKVWNIMAIITLLCIFGSLLLAVFYQPIADIWIGKGELEVSPFTLLMFVLLTSETVVVNMANCFSNGFGRLKCQAICTILGAIIKLPIAFAVVHLVDNWTAIILATILSTLPILVCQPINIYRYICKLTEL